MSIWEILLSSGLVVKLVLLVLILSSVFAWAIINEKRKAFKKVEQSDLIFLDFFRGTTSLSEILIKARENSDSNLGKLFRKGHEELQKLSERIGQQTEVASIGDYLNNHGIAPLERALKQASIDCQTEMENKLSFLASIGSITPFIGLFGTVWGIIDAFTGLSSGGGTIEAVAPGIAEALVATAIGLVAAIPAVLFFNYFNGKVGTMMAQMESFSHEFLNVIERSVLLGKNKNKEK